MKLTDVIENRGPEDLIQEEVWKVESIAQSDQVHKGLGHVMWSDLVQLAHAEMCKVESIMQSDRVHKGLGRVVRSDLVQMVLEEMEMGIQVRNNNHIECREHGNNTEK